MTARAFRLTAFRAKESEEQAVLFTWAAFAERQYPELRLLFAIPNGTAASSMAEAVKGKKTGTKRGVPDLFLPVPRRKPGNAYAGLWIELKRLDATPCSIRPEQKQWVHLTVGSQR